jgi:glycosyltransferase involved in cell wall biosynthesis
MMDMTDTADAITPDTSKLTISIAMATYNGAKYIREQLDSLAAQTLLPDELIISDDGSTDETISIIEGFMKTSPFPVLVSRNEQRLGYADNFVRAVGLCKSKIIAFCDQDDVWLPEKIATVMAVFQTSDDMAVGHNFGVIDAAGVVTLPSYFAYLAHQKLPARLCVKGCTLAFRQTLITACGWPAPSIGISHDVWVATLAEAAGRRSTIADVLISHRIHGANVSGYLAQRDKMSRGRSLLRKFMFSKSWVSLDIFMTCYFPAELKYGPTIAAGIVAQNSVIFPGGVEKWFAWAAIFHARLSWKARWIRK